MGFVLDVKNLLPPVYNSWISICAEPHSPWGPGAGPPRPAPTTLGGPRHSSPAPRWAPPLAARPPKLFYFHRPFKLDFRLTSFFKFHLICDCDISLTENTHRKKTKSAGFSMIWRNEFWSDMRSLHGKEVQAVNFYWPSTLGAVWRVSKFVSRLTWPLSLEADVIWQFTDKSRFRDLREILWLLC